MKTPKIMAVLFFYILIIITLTGCNREASLEGEIFIVTQGGQSIKLGLVEVLAIPEIDAQKYINEKDLASLQKKTELREKYIKAKDEYEKDYQRITEKNKKIELQKKHVQKMIDEAGNRILNALNSSKEKELQAAITDQLRWEHEYYNLDISDPTVNINLKNIAQNEFLEWPKGDFYFNDLPLSKTVGKATTNDDGRFTITLPSEGKYLLAAHTQRQIGDQQGEYYWLIWVTVTSKDKDHIMLSNNNLFGTNAPESAAK
jgi:hypothetical protein